MTMKTPYYHKPAYYDANANVIYSGDIICLILENQLIIAKLISIGRDYFTSYVNPAVLLKYMHAGFKHTIFVKVHEPPSVLHGAFVCPEVMVLTSIKKNSKRCRYVFPHELGYVALYDAPIEPQNTDDDL